MALPAGRFGVNEEVVDYLGYLRHDAELDDGRSLEDLVGGATPDNITLFEKDGILSSQDSNGRKEDTTIGTYSHVEGLRNTASGQYSHAEGFVTTASGQYSHAEGYGSQATESRTHAEGHTTKATGSNSHAEGYYTSATGEDSHAEGNHSTAIGRNSHAEGLYCESIGTNSHAEGNHSTAGGINSHAEGNYSAARGMNSHAGGYSTDAGADYSFAHGNTLQVVNDCGVCFGKFNDPLYELQNRIIFSIGNGESGNDRKNIFSVDDNGIVHSEQFMQTVENEGATTKHTFKFGVDEYGNYGYKKPSEDGADTVIPFNNNAVIFSASGQNRGSTGWGEVRTEQVKFVNDSLCEWVSIGRVRMKVDGIVHAYYSASGNSTTATTAYGAQTNVQVFDTTGTRILDAPSTGNQTRIGSLQISFEVKKGYELLVAGRGSSGTQYGGYSVLFMYTPTEQLTT